MHLAATSQTEFWDPQDELLFTGTWCARHDRRADWQGRTHRFLPNPWEDAQRFKSAAAYCHQTSEHLLAALTPYLNGILNASFSQRYWRILLNPWLRYHVQQMYDHHVHIQDAFAAYPGLKTTKLDPSCFVTPTDTQDFIRLSLGDFYHLQIFSTLLPEARNFPLRSCAPPPRPKAPAPSLKDRLKSAAARTLGMLTPKNLGDVLIADLYLNREEQKRLIRQSKFKALPYWAELPGSLKPEPVLNQRRQGLAGLQAQDDFQRRLIAALPVYFPTLFLEGHDAARSFSLSRLWRTPRVVFSAIGWHYNEAFKFAAAECAERGSELWALQHGGVYGLWDHADGEIFERALSDRFYSWGWSSLAQDPKVRDLPHPLFARGGPSAPGKDILFVSTVLGFHNIRLSRDQQNTLALEYIERQGRFLNAMPDLLRHEVFVRLFKHDEGWRHDERLRALYPALQLDDVQRPFPRRLKTARLAVFDNPMTTFLEALAADIPTILTWNPEHFVFRDAAKPFLKDLKEAGIFHESPEEAARQVALVYEHPRVWWDAPETRKAHRAFAEHFARGGADWLAAWLKEIRAA